MAVRNRTNIPWKNIFYMIRYATDELQYFEPDDIRYERLSGVNELLAAMLLTTLKEVERHGFLRGYESKNIVTSKPSGKIDMLESYRNSSIGKGQLTCRVDRLTIDNEYNRIIKTAIEKLINSNVFGADHIEDENILRKLYYYRNILKNVAEIHVENNLINSIFSLRPSRIYKQALTVSAIILEDFLALDEEGNYRLMNLNRNERLGYIFEKYIRKFYITNYGSENVEISKKHLQNGSIHRYPDVFFEFKNEKRIVMLDAKYYGSGEDTQSSVNMDKMVHYCDIIDAKEGINYPEYKGYSFMGALVYAAINERDLSRDELETRESMLCQSLFVSINGDMNVVEDRLRRILEHCIDTADGKRNTDRIIKKIHR
jgi:5-methylcytosine-specific restriction endonuclease McrBC regulatory subunit McrC